MRVINFYFDGTQTPVPWTCDRDSNIVLTYGTGSGAWVLDPDALLNDFFQPNRNAAEEQFVLLAFTPGIQLTLLKGQVIIFLSTNTGGLAQLFLEDTQLIV